MKEEIVQDGDKNRVYLAGGQVFRIAEQDKDAFLKDFPDAEEGSIYRNYFQKDVFVSSRNQDEILKDHVGLVHVDGTYLLKKKADSTSLGPVQRSKQPNDSPIQSKEFVQDGQKPPKTDTPGLKSIQPTSDLQSPETQEEDVVPVDFDKISKQLLLDKPKRQRDILASKSFTQEMIAKEEAKGEDGKKAAELLKKNPGLEYYRHYAQDIQAAEAVSQINPKYRIGIEDVVHEYMANSPEGQKAKKQMMAYKHTAPEELQKKIVTDAFAYKSDWLSKAIKKNYSLIEPQIKELKKSSEQIARLDSSIKEIGVTEQLTKDAERISKKPNPTQQDADFIKDYNERVSKLRLLLEERNRLVEQSQAISNSREMDMFSALQKEYTSYSNKIGELYKLYKGNEPTPLSEKTKGAVKAQEFVSPIAPYLYDLGGRLVDETVRIGAGIVKAPASILVSINEAIRDLVLSEYDPSRYRYSPNESMLRAFLSTATDATKAMKLTDESERLINKDGSFNLYGLTQKTVEAIPNFLYFAKAVPVLKAAGLGEGAATGVAVFAGFYADTYERAVNELGLDGVAALQYSVFSSGVEALSERILPNYKVLQSNVVRGLTKAYAKGAASAVPELAHQAGMTELKKSAPKIVATQIPKSIAQGGLEAAEEIVAEIGDIVNSYIINAMYNKDLPTDLPDGEGLLEVTLPVLITTFAFGVGSDISSAKSFSVGDYQALDAMTSNYAESVKILDEIKKEHPTANTEMVLRMMQNYDAMRSRMPQEIEGWKRPLLATLISEQDRIKEVMSESGIDPSILSAYEDELKEVQGMIGQVIAAKIIPGNAENMIGDEPVEPTITPSPALIGYAQEAEEYGVIEDVEDVPSVFIADDNGDVLEGLIVGQTEDGLNRVHAQDGKEYVRSGEDVYKDRESVKVLSPEERLVADEKVEQPEESATNVKQEPVNLTQEGGGLNQSGVQGERSFESEKYPTADSVSATEELEKEYVLLNNKIHTKKGNIRKGAKKEDVDRLNDIRKRLIASYVTDVLKEEEDFKKQQIANTQKEIKDFESMAYSGLSEQESFEAVIEDKAASGEELTDEELDYVNKNYFVLSGYEYDKNWGLVKKDNAITAETPQTTPPLSEQIKSFGVGEDDVTPIQSVIERLFEGLKEAGLVEDERVEDWVGIGKKPQEKGVIDEITQNIEVPKLPLVEAKKEPVKIKSESAGQNTNKITDVGEKIGGAKKDLAEKLGAVTTDDIKSLPLSKLFPKPDFDKLISEKGISRDIAILLNYLYSKIPAKPRRAYQHFFDTIREKEEDGKSVLYQIERHLSTKADSKRQPISKEAYKKLIEILSKSLGGKAKIVDAETFEKEAKKTGNSVDLKTKDGVVYGAYLPGGVIYINEDALNANTPIHEFTHLFNQIVRGKNPALWNSIVEAVKQTETWEEVKTSPDYSNLKTDDEIADEAFSRIVGDLGEGKWEQYADKPLYKKILDYIKSLFNEILSLFGNDVYKGMSAGGLANLTLNELLGGISKTPMQIANQIRDILGKRAGKASDFGKILFDIDENTKEKLEKALGEKDGRALYKIFRNVKDVERLIAFAKEKFPIRGTLHNFRNALIELEGGNMVPFGSIVIYEEYQKWAADEVVEEIKKAEPLKPGDLLKQVGYELTQTTSLGDAKKKFAHFYKDDEIICTIKSDSSRHVTNFVTFAVRDDALITPHAEDLTQDNLTERWKDYLEKKGRKNPDGTFNLIGVHPHSKDPYSTSVISLQIEKANGLTREISRYNHTLASPDNILGGDFNKLVDGLEDAMFHYFAIEKNTKRYKKQLPVGVIQDANGRYFSYSEEHNGIYSGDGFYVRGGVVTILDRGSERMVDGFVINANGDVVNISRKYDEFPYGEVKKVNYIRGNEISVETENGTFVFETNGGQVSMLKEYDKYWLFEELERKGYKPKYLKNGGLSIDMFSKMDNVYWNENVVEIRGNGEFSYSQLTSLGSLQVIGGDAYFRHSQLTSLGSLQVIEGNAYFRHSQLTSLGSLQVIGGNGEFSNSQLTSLGSLRVIGGDAYFSNSQLTSLGSLRVIGGGIYNDNPNLDFNNLPSSKDAALAKAREIVGIFRAAIEKFKENGNTRSFNELLPEEYRLNTEGGDPLFKDAQAQYHIRSGKNIIEAVKDFDGSPAAAVALAHEIIHPVIVSVIDGAKSGNKTGKRHLKTIVDEYNKASETEVTEEQMIADNDAFKGGTTTEAYRSVQEFIAEAWEEYIHEGPKGFGAAFQAVLDIISAAFKAVYEAVTGKKLTKELRDFFDELLKREGAKQPVSEKDMAKSRLADKLRSRKANYSIIEDDAVVDTEANTIRVTQALKHILGDFGVETDSDKIDEVLGRLGKKGNIAGFVHGNKIYIDLRLATPETPLHEIVGHVFLAWAKQNSPDLYAMAISLASEAPESVVNHVEKNYPELRGVDKAEEIFSTFLGRATAGKYTAKPNSIFEKILAWLRVAFDGIGRFFNRNFNRKNITAEDFKGMTLSDFVDKLSNLAMSNKIRFDNIAKTFGFEANIVGPVVARALDDLENTGNRMARLEEAKEMFANGVKDTDIYDMTGWVFSDGVWKYEEDYLEFKDAQGLYFDLISLPVYKTTVGEIMKGPVLNYHGIKDKTITFVTRDYDPNQQLRAYVDTKGNIVVFTQQIQRIMERPVYDVSLELNDLRGIRRIITHEVQHLVQREEGWQEGASLESVRDVDLQEYKREKLAKLKNRLQVLNEILPVADELAQAQYAAIDKKIQAILDGSADIKLEVYKDVVGEIEARLAEVRSLRTKSQRKEIMFTLMQDRTEAEKIMIQRGIATAMSYSPVYDEAANARIDVSANDPDFNKKYTPSVRVEDISYVPISEELRPVEKSILYAFENFAIDKNVARQFSIALQSNIYETHLYTNETQSYFGYMLQKAVIDGGAELRHVASQYRALRTQSSIFSDRETTQGEAWNIATGMQYDAGSFQDLAPLTQKANIDSEIWDIMKDYILSSFKTQIYDFDEIAAELINSGIIEDAETYGDLADTYADISSQLSTQKVFVDGVNNGAVFANTTIKLPSFDEIKAKIETQKAYNERRAAIRAERDDALSVYGFRPRSFYAGTGGTNEGRFFVKQPPLKFLAQSNKPLTGDWRIERSYPNLSKDQMWATMSILDRFNNGGKAFLLADGPGVGKTAIIMASAIEWAIKTGKPVLVVTKNDQIVEDRFIPDAKNILGYTSGLPIQVVTYTKLTDMVAKGKTEQYGMVAFDEAHVLSNPTSDRSIAASSIDADHFLYATATPFEKLWGLDYLMPKLLQISQEQFRSTLGYEVKMKSEYNYATKTYETNAVIEKTRDITNQQLRKYVRQMRAIAISQGAMMKREFPFWGDIEMVSISQTPQERANEDAVFDYWQHKIDAAKSKNSKINYGMLRANELSRINEPAKLSVVTSAIDFYIKAGKKVVVFVSQVSDTTEIKGLGGKEITTIMPGLKKFLKENGISYGMIGGQSVAKKRSDAEDFQEDKIDVLLATYESASTGIDLDDQLGTKERVVIAATVNYSASVFQQAMYRVSRRNTKSPSLFIGILNDGKSDTRRAEIVEQKARLLSSIQTGATDEIEIALPDSIGGVKQEKQPYIGTYNGHRAVFNDWSIRHELDKVPGVRWNRQRGEQSARVLYRPEYLPMVEAIVGQHNGGHASTLQQRAEQAAKDFMDALRKDAGYMGVNRIPFRSMYAFARLVYFKSISAINNYIRNLSDSTIAGDFISGIVQNIKDIVSDIVNSIFSGLKNAYNSFTSTIKSAFNKVADAMFRAALLVKSKANRLPLQYAKEGIPVKEAFTRIYNETLLVSADAADFVVRMNAVVATIQSGGTLAALNNIPQEAIETSLKYLNQLVEDVVAGRAVTIDDVESNRRFMTSDEAMSDVGAVAMKDAGGYERKRRPIIDVLLKDFLYYSLITANRTGMPASVWERKSLEKIGREGRGIPLDRMRALIRANGTDAARLYADIGMDKFLLNLPDDGTNPATPKLNSKEYDLFAEYILATRIKERVGRLDTKTGNMSEERAESMIDAIKVKLRITSPNRGWSDFERRIDIYDKVIKENLKMLYDAGHISKAAYDAMKDNFYATFSVISTSFTQVIMNDSIGGYKNEVIFNMEGIQDGVARMEALNRTYPNLVADYMAGTIELHELFDAAYSSAWDDLNNGTITEADFNRLMSEMAMPGFTLFNILDATKLLLRKSKMIELMQVEANYVYSIADDLVSAGATDVKIVTKDVADSYRLLEGEGLFYLKHEGREMAIIMDKAAANALKGASPDEMRIFSLITKIISFIGLQYLLRFDVITMSESFLAINYGADTFRTLLVPQPKIVNLSVTNPKRTLVSLLNLALLPSDILMGLMQGVQVALVEYMTTFQEEAFFGKKPAINKSARISTDKALPKDYKEMMALNVAIGESWVDTLVRFDRKTPVLRVAKPAVDLFALPLKATEVATKIMGFRRARRWHDLLESTNYDYKVAMDVGINTGTPLAVDSRKWVKLFNSIIPFFGMRYAGAVDDLASFLSAATGNIKDFQGRYYGTTMNQRMRSNDALTTISFLSSLLYFKIQQFESMGRAELYKNFHIMTNYMRYNMAMVYKDENFDIPYRRPRLDYVDKRTGDIKTERMNDTLEMRDAYTFPARGVFGSINSMLDEIAYRYVMGTGSDVDKKYFRMLASASPVELEGLTPEGLIATTNPSIKILYELLSNKRSFSGRNYVSDEIVATQKKAREYFNEVMDNPELAKKYFDEMDKEWEKQKEKGFQNGRRLTSESFPFEFYNAWDGAIEKYIWDAREISYSLAKLGRFVPSWEILVVQENLARWNQKERFDIEKRMASAITLSGRKYPYNYQMSQAYKLTVGDSDYFFNTAEDLIKMIKQIKKESPGVSRADVRVYYPEGGNSQSNLVNKEIMTALRELN